MAFDACYTESSSFPASKSLKNFRISFMADSGTFKCCTDTIPPGASPALSPVELPTIPDIMSHCSRAESVVDGAICRVLELTSSILLWLHAELPQTRNTSTPYAIRFIVASRAPDHPTRSRAPRVTAPAPLPKTLPSAPPYRFRANAPEDLLNRVDDPAVPFV